MDDQYEKCLEIYENYKNKIYWYLKKYCGWLSEQDIHDIMKKIWKDVANNYKISLYDEINLLTIAYVTAIERRQK